MPPSTPLNDVATLTDSSLPSRKVVAPPCRIVVAIQDVAFDDALADVALDEFPGGEAPAVLKVEAFRQHRLPASVVGVIAQANPDDLVQALFVYCLSRQAGERLRQHVVRPQTDRGRLP